jgi:hypothetical protein
MGRSLFLIGRAAPLLLLVAAPALAEETTGYGQGATGANGTQVGIAGWVEASTGYLTLFNDPTGETACVDVWGGGSRAQTGLGMWTCSGSANQSWKLTAAGAIVGIDNECIDLPHSITTPGTQVQLFPCNGGSNQLWIPEGDHTIRSGVDASVCLALPSGSNIYSNPNQGLKLIVDTCNAASTNQQWMIHSVGQFIGLGDTVLDIPRGDTTNGKPLDVWSANGGNNQKWTWAPRSGFIFGENGKCVDLGGGTLTPGAQPVINDCATGSLTQSWIIQGTTLRPTHAPYLCLMADAPIQLAPCDGTTAQNWEYSQPLTVPVEAQQESQWCWATVAQMTMAYLGNLGGGTPTQCQELNKRLGFTGSQDCCATQSWNDPTIYNGAACDHSGGTNDILNDWGFGFTCNGSPVSFATLQSETGAGRPVPTGIGWNGPGGGGHALLVIGTEVDSGGTQWVIINDPWGAGAGSQGDQVAMTYSTWSNTNPNVGAFTTGRVLTNVAYGSSGTCN